MGGDCVEHQTDCGKTKITVLQGDITKLKVDAIVNAANERLRGGGGVDGAIHRAGGPQILEECKKYLGCPTGEARLTSAGNMPSKYVIHTVGPVYRGGQNNEAYLLESAYKSSLKMAAENNVRTIAFPFISAGVYGYPKEEASGIAVNTVKKFIEEYPENAYIDKLWFYLGNYYFNQSAYRKALHAYERIEQRMIPKENLTEYEFKLGYAYFVAEKFKEAKPLLSKAKDKESQYKSKALFYYSHILYTEKNYRTFARVWLSFGYARRVYHACLFKWKIGFASSRGSCRFDRCGKRIRS